MGKSSLIKTLMSSFGAKPAKISDAWMKLNPMSLVRFSIDSQQYAILKEGHSYAVFDAKGGLMKLCTSVIEELGPFLAELVDFKITLPDKKNNIVVPPPPFIFLPFYIDQDKSWGENWAGFAGLSHMKQGRDAIAFYHTGVRGNEYYTTKNALVKSKEEYDKMVLEVKAVRGLISRLADTVSTVDFNINVELFKHEVEELLEECGRLKEKEEAHKGKLMDLYNVVIALESQYKITEAAMLESRKDYNFATNRLPDHVECPTCGAEYENSFGERFAIAMDTARCDELLLEINEQLTIARDKIEKENRQLNETTQEVAKIHGILLKRQGEIRLKDIIEKEGANQVRTIFSDNLSTLRSDMFSNREKQEELEAKWRSFDDKKKKKEIEKYYLEHMEANLHSLEVKTLERSAYKALQSSINETGSTLPRALMAYYFAIFETINKFSTSVFCPLVIDSPDQQGQDKANIGKIYQFIKEHQPANSQMILVIEESVDIDFECKVIELNEKFGLLQRKEYDQVVEDLRPFYNQVLSAQNKLF